MAANINLLQWAPAWEIGVRQIDDDHRLLVDQSNALYQALAESRPKAEIMTIIGRMESGCWEHFRREEAILREAKYHGVDAHVAEHRRIEGELQQVVHAMGVDDVSVPAWKEFVLFFQTTLVNHLLLYDLRYKSHLLWYQSQ